MKYEIEITDLNHQGEGIGRINEKIIFVPKTLGGDRIECVILKEHKNFFEGKLVRIIFPSSKREEYICPYYDTCGGCHIANLDYDNQLKYKKEKVIDIFKKYSNNDINPEIFESDKKLSYRNKVTLHVFNNKLGFYEEKSNKLIEIDKCLLLSPKMNEVISLLKTIDLNRVNLITIRESSLELMLIVSGKINKDELNELKDICKTIIVNDNVLFGKGYILENINNYKYTISPESFFQVNRNVTKKLYNKILEYANLNKNDNVLDLYCGTGTIGISLANYCNTVLGIEINKSAIKDANENKARNNVCNISFKCGDVSKLLEDNMKYDVVIVDPPRSGLDKKTKNILQKILPNRIVYTSCDPMTLARDIKDLDNYKLNDITLFDMFPNTYHVECVCVLKLR